MRLRPLHDHVLIKPLASEDSTESGLVLVEHRKPEQMGEVLAVGTPRHPLKEQAEELVKEFCLCEGPTCDDRKCRAARLLQKLVAREPCCAVGDLVLFSWAAGQEIFDHDADARYLLLKESDLLAVIES